MRTRNQILIATLIALAPLAGSRSVQAADPPPTLSSGNFTLLPAESTASGGGPVANGGATITAEISVGDTVAGGVSNVSSAGVQAKGGYTGQLIDAQSLDVSAAPAAVEEGETTQVSGVATMDDDTLIAVGGVDAIPADWTILDGPIDSIDADGLATVGSVFLNGPANIRGSFDGIEGDVALVVLNQTVADPVAPADDPDFTEQDFDPAQVGTYQGLLTDAGGNVVGAIIGLRLRTDGAFTARVFFNGSVHRLKGSFDEFGDLLGAEIERKGLDPLAVDLRIGQTSDGGLSIQGTIVGDGTTGMVVADHAPYHSRNNPAPVELVKKYTFIIPSTGIGDNADLPRGDGYGAISVNAAGKITAKGKTGDGTRFSSRGYLTTDDQWQLFQPLFRGQGHIAGVITFRDVIDVSDLDGELHWVKNPNPKQKSYPNGFDLPPVLVGSVFSRKAKGERLLDQLADQHYNALLTLAGNTVPDIGVDKVISWQGNNALSYYGPERLRARASASTGLINGSYYNPLDKTRIRFGGAVLQKQDLASGNFLYNNEAGYLFVEPGTDFPYPSSADPGALDLTALPATPADDPVLTPLTAFDEAAAGVFSGFLKDNGSGDQSGALENVKLTATGAISGKIWINGTRYSFRGIVDANTGQVQLSLPRKDLPDVTVALQLALADGTTDGFALTGQANEDGTLFDIDAQRRPDYSKLDPAPETGVYTVAMRAPTGTDPALEPGGDGYGSIKVRETGVSTGRMVLADGTKATLAGHTSRSGEWSVHRSLYGNRGFIAGKLFFRDVVGVSDLDGDLRWIKNNEVPRTKNYLAGFDVTRTVIGGSYVPPAKGESAFASLDDEFYNAWLRLAGPDLAPTTPFDILSLDRAVTWNSANRVLYYGPDSAKIRFSSRTGLATGSYRDRQTGANVKFGGALIQEQALLTGSYLSGEQSGIFTIAPR